MSKPRLVLVLLILILLLGGFFRFYDLAQTPPGLYPDEAMNGNNALETLHNTNFSAFGWKIFYPENNGREGFFINIQALSLKLFGNEPWALRGVSALFGTLTILGVYLLARELFKNPQIALLSSFFVSVSYWHINFSRIGFRAIMVPLLAAFGAYFLLRGLRTGKIWDMVIAGIFVGLGFHTYIAFRFMPFVLAVPILWYLWSWYKNRPTSYKLQATSSCTPCLILLFLFITFIAALPIGYYFLQNPGDFLGRTGQVSIMTAESPLLEFAKSNLATAGMFFYKGDCNWRHNLACRPQLNPIVAVFFAIGTAIAVQNLFMAARKFQIPNSKFQINPNNQNSNKQNAFGAWGLRFGILLVWLLFLSLPATLTKEGLPHALRAIGMIPPVMILAGVGAWKIWEFIQNWLELQKQKKPLFLGQLARIQKEVAVLGILLLLIVPLFTFRSYFVHWAQNPNTYFAFSTDLLHLGQYLDGLPDETRKYVVVNLPGVEVRGIPMPAQTVMFATDTFGEQKRREKNIIYLLPEQVDSVILEQNTIFAIMEGKDLPLIKTLQRKFPELKASAPADFVVLEN